MGLLQTWRLPDAERVRNFLELSLQWSVPMNSTSQSSGYSSGPNAIDGKTLLMTLLASTALGYLSVLAIYVVAFGQNPGARLGYGLLVSVLPAVGAYVVLKLTNLFISWRGAVIVYVAFFVLVVFVQAFARLVPVR